MLTARENPLYRKISPEEDRTRDAVDSEPKHYQRAIPAPWRHSNHETLVSSGGALKKRSVCIFVPPTCRANVKDGSALPPPSQPPPPTPRKKKPQKEKKPRGGGGGREKGKKAHPACTIGRRIVTTSMVG